MITTQRINKTSNQKSDENIIKVRFQNILTSTLDNQSKIQESENHLTRQLRRIWKQKEK
jgi:hypothetical protein